jgi:hypothetical protein
MATKERAMVKTQSDANGAHQRCAKPQAHYLRYVGANPTVTTIKALLLTCWMTQKGLK